jgi:hypothetical protein
MTPQTPRFPEVFLAELMNPYTGEIEETDVCAKLELAVEKVYLHLVDYKDSLINVEVSFDADNAIEGVGFFDENHELVSCVTVYHLDRDTGSATVAGLGPACRGDKQALQQELNRIFRN